MPSPSDAWKYAREVADTYAAAELELMRVIARRLARDLEEPWWADRKLGELRALRADAERIMARASRLTVEQVQSALLKSANEGQRSAAAAARAAGQRATAVAWEVPSAEAVAMLVKESMTGLGALQPRILRATEDIYRAVVARAASTALAGGTTRVGAAQAAMDQFAARGVTGFVDAAGRSWNMASYAEMTMRTSTGRACITSALDMFKALDQDLVYINASGGGCEACDPYEGEVLSLSGNDPRYVSMSEAEGDGLFHPNCRHEADLYIEGVTQLPELTGDPMRYAAEQRQRSMERTLRGWKMREASSLTPAARAKSASKVGEWQAKIAAHVDDNNLTRLYGRESITHAH